MSSGRVHLGPGRRSTASRRLRDLLRAAIWRRQFPNGVLPSEASIMLTYSASRGAVRDALSYLREEGVIDRVQGTGTFVISNTIQHRYDSSRGVRPDPRAGPAGDLTYHFLSCSLVQAPEPVATQLGLPPGSACTVTEYLTKIDGAPYGVNTSYLGPEYSEKLESADFSVDWYGLLESLGIPVGGSRQTVEATLADDLYAALLDIQVGSPIMFFERIITDTAGRTVDYGFARFRGDQLTLRVELPRRHDQRD
ncbi:GntR family transcriptional regulator [Pseudofrankia sp. BMG5.37]|nr:GntR family transcriptional regulator [Pseudofrankia sp. BMG5.36]MDT3441444.1 GntR family transcriptional regulator [Pseudofrankia sp. BMG5.37]OHV48884.1 hypothetical protein BCD48_13540 [Pseudofrankia sp. BMG5.36]